MNPDDGSTWNPFRTASGTHLCALLLTSVGCASWDSWDHHGTFSTTDAEGAEWTVDVYSRLTNDQIPPGAMPRIRIEGTRGSERAAFTHDTSWRYPVEVVRAVQGGIEVLMHSGTDGLRLELRRGAWIITDDRLQDRGLFKMTIELK